MFLVHSSPTSIHAKFAHKIRNRIRISFVGQFCTFYREFDFSFITNVHWKGNNSQKGNYFRGKNLQLSVTF